MNGDASYVGAYLKQHDRDRYNASLILPEKERRSVQALMAFNADIAHIPLRVTEPTPGEIRLQWWVDLLEGSEHGMARQNPLASGLLDAINDYDLPTGPLRRLLAARRFDLYGDPMPDLETFEGYAGETNSILYQLTTIVLNKGNDAGAATAAGHIGVAHALIGHLRSLSQTIGRGRIFLPWSVFAANGVEESELLAGQPTIAILQTIAQLREIAGEHLTKATDAIKLLPENVRPAFASIAVLRPQLLRLEEFAGIPFVCPPDFANWQKIAKIVWWSYRGHS